GIFACILVMLPGCFPGPAPDDPPKPREGVTLRVAAPNAPALRQLLRRHGNGWCDLSGAKLDIVAPTADADMIVFAPAELPGLISAGKAAQLPSAFADHRATADLGYFLRPYRMRLMDWQTKKYAVPILGDSMLFAWRADLLDNPIHKNALENRLKHPLNPVGPATWQEVETVALYFHETANWTEGDGGKAPRPSLPPLPDSPEALDRPFHAVAAPFVQLGVSDERMNRMSDAERRALLYHYQFDIDTGEPLIGGPGFIAALSLLQRLKECRPAGRSAHPAEALANGTAV